MTELRNIRVEIAINATPERVFRALTEQEELQAWFAAQADVSLGERKYNFWGPSIPEASFESDCACELTELIENESLRYSWRLREQETEVQISIEALGSERTKVVANHTGVPFIEPTESSLSDFWSISLDNLRSWIERGEEGAQFDFSKTPHGEAHVAIDIDASKSEVFEALINPSLLDRYIGRGSEVVPEVGGTYDLGWKVGGPIKILELVPDERLAYSWIYGDEPETVATWTLEDSGGKTRLMVVHSGFALDRPCEDYYAGWAKYLTWIKSLVETGSKWVAPRILSTDYSYTLS